MFSFEILPSVTISIRSAEGLALLSKVTTTGNPIIFSKRRFESVLLEKISLLLTELESSSNASSPSTDDVITELLEDVSLFRGQWR